MGFGLGASTMIAGGIRILSIIIIDHRSSIIDPNLSGMMDRQNVHPLGLSTALRALGRFNAHHMTPETGGVLVTTALQELVAPKYMSTNRTCVHRVRPFLEALFRPKSIGLELEGSLIRAKFQIVHDPSSVLANEIRI